MRNDNFLCDAFLFFNQNDRSITEEAASWLVNAGLHVAIGTKQKLRNNKTSRNNMETSRTLLLMLSKAMLKEDLSSIEPMSVGFRNPDDRKRRFLPVLIDDCLEELPESLKRYKFVDLRSERDGKFAYLTSLCKPQPAQLRLPRAQGKSKAETPPGDALFKILRDLSVKRPAPSWDFDAITGATRVKTIDIAPDCRRILVGAENRSIQLWDLVTGKWIGAFEEHWGTPNALATAPDGKRFASGSDRGNMRIWNLVTGDLLGQISQADPIQSIAWSPDGKTILFGDQSGALTTVHSRKMVAGPKLRLHSSPLNTIAFSSDSKHFATGSDDGSVKVLDLGNHVPTVLKGHSDPVTSIAFINSNREIVSSSEDSTLRVWNLESERAIAVLEGHKGPVRSLAVATGTTLCASASDDCTVRLWDLQSGNCIHELELNSAVTAIRFTQHSQHLIAGLESGSVRILSVAPLDRLRQAAPIYTTTKYTNAKVVLVGESSIGKSCLGQRLVRDEWIVGESTHGMRIWLLSSDSSADGNNLREVWLWDLAGQPEYRLVHQLFLDETSLALVIFDPSDPDDPFRGIAHWENALRAAVDATPAKLLVSAKVDRGAAAVTASKLKLLMDERGYTEHVATSAKTGEGRSKLLEAIFRNIPWDRTPWINTPTLFKKLKDAIVSIRDEGLVVVPFAALRQQLRIALREEDVESVDLRVVIRLLAGQGLIKELDFGDIVLLKPELLNNYAAAVVREARGHVDGIGCICEQSVLLSLT